MRFDASNHLSTVRIRLAVAINIELQFVYYIRVCMYVCMCVCLGVLCQVVLQFSSDGTYIFWPEASVRHLVYS